MVKINQMKKDELFEGFYLIKSADVRQTRAGKNILPLSSKMRQARLKENCGMLSHIMWSSSKLVASFI